MKRIKFICVLALVMALGVCLTTVGRLQTSGGKDSVLLFFGVYTQWYGLEKSLADYDIRISNAHSKGVEYFPSPKELSATKLVILSDVSGGEFTQSQVQQIESYVEHGGSVLVLGGPFTLGLGKFSECGLDKILPVLLEPFDLKPAKEGLPFSKVVDHPLVDGMDLSSKPMVYWLHRVRPKPGAVIVLKAGGYPLLVTGKYGKGKVIVFTGTPMGIPAEEDMPFWKSSEWSRLVCQIAKQR